MDVKLIGRALQFHGVNLLRSFNEEQQEPPSSAILSYLERRQPQEPEIKDDEFHKNVCAFIGRKSDLLFKPLTEEEKNHLKHEESIDDSYAIMPPLEVFMDVSEHGRREHFYKSLKSDDCVTGAVISILDNGLRVQLLCVDKGCARDIEDLNIVAFCPAKELPKLYAGESALDAFQEKDIVRGIVLSVSPEAERIILSLHEKAIPDEKSYPRIGLITEDEFPVSFRRKSQIQGMSYGEMMQSILGFNNQGNVNFLLSQHGIQDTSSYLRCQARLKIPEKEFAEGLRKWQSQKLAHQSVAQGVERFKEGKYLEALQHFNRALQIDDQNVEALVARGALHANKENFRHAIQDFEEALSVNPKHGNARNYLIETLLTFGKICEDSRQPEEACMHYKHVLKVDPEHVEAKEMLAGCQWTQCLMTFQNTSEEDSLRQEQKGKVKKSRDSEGRDDGKQKKADASDLSKTTEKLLQLIQEDKKGKSRKKKKARRHSGSSSHSKDARKKKKRKRSSSNTSSDSSSQDSRGRSRSRSSSPGTTRHFKSRRSQGDSGDDDHQSKKRGRKTSSSTSPTSPRDTKLKTDQGKRSSMEAQTMRKMMPVTTEEKILAKTSDSTKKDDIDAFAMSVQTSAAASFLPVSSRDFFGNSAIPGLGSPPPAEGSAEDVAGLKETFAAVDGRNADKRSDRGSGQVLRSADSLMAEREKFYQDNRDRYRAKSSSSSRSSQSWSSCKRQKSRGRQTSRSRSRGRRTSRSRSRGRQSSRSRFHNSPVITGVKELDMYLGGAKKIRQNYRLDGRYSTWESFTGNSLPSATSGREHRSVSRDKRPKSIGRRSQSRSPRKRKDTDSSKHKTDKGNDGDSRTSSQSGFDQSDVWHNQVGKISGGDKLVRSEKFATTQARHGDRMGQDISESRHAEKRYSNVPHHPSYSHQTASSSSQMEGREGSRGRDEMRKTSRDVEEERSRVGRGESEDKNVRREKSGSVEVSLSPRGFGKFGPNEKKVVSETVINAAAKSQVDFHTDEYAIHKLEESPDDKEKGASRFVMAKRLKDAASWTDTQARFMPRVISVSKTNASSVSKPMSSSYRPSTMEHERKGIERGSMENMGVENRTHVTDDRERDRHKSSGRSWTGSEHGDKEIRSDRNDERKTMTDTHITRPKVGSGSRNKERDIEKDRLDKPFKKSADEESHKYIERGTEHVLKIEDDLSRVSEDKKLLEVDIEKEIERRVQQRLKEEEAKLKMMMMKKEEGITRKCRWDDTGANTAQVIHAEGVKMKTLIDNARKLAESMKSSTDHKRTQDSANKKHLVSDGVFLDDRSEDMFGHPHSVQGGCPHSNSGRSSGAQIVKKESVDTTHSRGVEPGRDTGREELRTRVRAMEHVRRNRDGATHRGEGRWRQKDERDRSGRGHRNLSRSHYSRSRSRSPYRGRRRRSGSRGRRLRSRSSSSESYSRVGSQRSQSKDEHKDSQNKLPSALDTKRTSPVHKVTADPNTSEDVKDVTSTQAPYSKWDRVGTSKWDDKQAMRGDADKDISEKDKLATGKQSLSELEKFLIDLKQQKKKQWIAEGKLKEKK